MFSKITTLALLFTATIAVPAMCMPVKHTAITVYPNQEFINGSCFGRKCNATLTAKNLNHTTKTHLTPTTATTNTMTTTTTTTNTTTTTTTSYNDTCIECMVLTSIIKGEIDLLNNTISNITHIIKEICSDEERRVAKECEYIVSSMNHITSLVHKNVNVTQICRDIGMCPNSTNSSTMPHHHMIM